MLFIILSMITWCSISFKLADRLWGEEKLFSNIRSAILTYVCSIFIAVVMTIGVYLLMIYLRIRTV